MKVNKKWGWKDIIAKVNKVCIKSFELQFEVDTICQSQKFEAQYIYIVSEKIGSSPITKTLE